MSVPISPIGAAAIRAAFGKLPSMAGPSHLKGASQILTGLAGSFKTQPKVK